MIAVLLTILAGCLLTVILIALWLHRHPPPEGCASCGMIGELEDHRCRRCAAEGG